MPDVFTRLIAVVNLILQISYNNKPPNCALQLQLKARLNVIISKAASLIRPISYFKWERIETRPLFSIRWLGSARHLIALLLNVTYMQTSN